MSSKSDDAVAERAPLSRSWSLSGRLALGYAASAFLILNLSAALVHWGLVRITTRQSNVFLKDEIGVMQVLDRSYATLEPLAQKLEVGYSARESMKTYARVLDPQGKLLIETYGMSARIPPDAFPPLPEKAASDGGKEWENVKGELFLLMVAPLEKGRVLQIGLDISYLQRVFADFRNVLMWVVAAGTVISTAAGALIVRKGLRPLKEIAERTAHITAYNLDDLVTLQHWPDEVIKVSTALDEMLERLKDSFDRLAGYASNMAHELRTPINILMGEAEVALSKARTADEYRRVIESNLEEYDRLYRIIDSLLFIARTDVHRVEPAREEIDICKEIEKIVAYYEPLAEDKGISITCGENAVLYADPTLFRRALGNLLSNSIHYTGTGGSITISTIQAAERALEVTVSDTGCGIAKEDLPKITDRFYRVDATRQMNKEGTGLGLAIVKSIMDLHGGSIRIASEPGKGTSITLVFPRSNITNLSS